MNRMKWLVVMCVCFGLAAGSYLVGCSDDDGLSCEQAVEKFLSDDCMSEALDVEQDLEDCFADCDDLEGEARVDCTDACLNDFVDATPSCGDSGMKLLSEDTDCGDCFETCGFVLVSCLDEGEDADFCLDNVFTCVAICAEIPM